MTNISLQIKSFILCFSTIVFFINSCNDSQHTYNLSSESKKYLEEVVELLKKKSVNKTKIDWIAFKQDVFQFAKNSQTIADTYPAIRYAITRLDDNHSYFSSAIGDEETQNEKPLPILKDEIVPANIGYIRIPFCIGDEGQTETYIKAITDKFLQQNNTGIKGWIVDLRDNFGGSMWPMIAAVGPLLQTGTQGYFFYPDNKATKWEYNNGKAYLDTTLLASNNNIVHVSGKSKIAVLINNKTASSGEAMAVLFKGYANTKLFGAQTFGVSTGCESFTLSDGSRINLATSVFADKNKTSYGDAVFPDIICTDDETLPKAMEWIYN